jgi:hypothetical protein
MARIGSPSRVLIVAPQTADSPALLAAVAERAAKGTCLFTPLVPASPHGLHRVAAPEDHGVAEAHRQLDAALPRLSALAGADVVGVVGSYDPLAAVQDAVNLLGLDEVIVSMLPARLSRWLRLGFPHKGGGLGVPVTEVSGGERAASPLSAA